MEITIYFITISSYSNKKISTRQNISNFIKESILLKATNLITFLHGIRSRVTIMKVRNNLLKREKKKILKKTNSLRFEETIIYERIQITCALVAENEYHQD